MTKRRQSSDRNYRSSSSDRTYKNTVVEQEYSTKGKIQTTTLIKPINENQRKLVQSIRDNSITLVSGGAGVGKNCITLFEAIKYINSELSPIKKLVYVRANVDMHGEKDFGIMPGEHNAKSLHLAYPILDNLVEFMEEGKAKFLLEKEVIEVLPISHVRGRSFANSFVCIDELQNANVHMIKALLTRISHGSKMVLLGDPGQIDVNHYKSGFSKVITALSSCNDVGIIKFNKQDIVRHALIGNILDRLEGLT